MHNKQFIISKKIISRDNFKHINLLNGYVLNFHEELNVVVAKDTVLIGHAFQGEISRNIPEKELLKMTDPIETYSTWNGRWVLLHKNEIHPDACAQIGIFYGKIEEELIISSSLALIAEMYKNKYHISEYMPLEYNLLLSWVPGPYTVIEGIRRLLPTQYLKLDRDFKVYFRNPISKTDYSKLSVEEIYTKIFNLQKCAFQYIEKYDFKRNMYADRKKNIFNIGLTAGYDSRMQAALMKKMGLNFKAHTFERRKSTEQADVRYPIMLAQILDIEWNYIPIEKRQAKRVIEYNKHTFDAVKDSDWKWHYTCGQYDRIDGDVLVRSSIWEAFSDYYVSFGSTAGLEDSEEIKYNDLRKIFETLDGNPVAEKSFKKYIEWVDEYPIKGLSWADRITFEQLMGIWDGNENQGKDLFSQNLYIFHPANSMEIFALILALPKDKRRNRVWEKEIANMFIPEFENIPYNQSLKDIKRDYYFPYKEEINEKNIVLYGAGMVGRSYYMQIMTQKKCKIVAWIDKNYKKIRESGIKVDPIEQIVDLEYDYLIVAVESIDLYKKISEDLINIGIEKGKVLWKETGIIYG